MSQIKTYDDFIQARKKTDEPIWKARHSAGSTNKINEIMKDYVLAPDFDKKRLLAYRVNYNNDTEYLFVKWLLKNTLAQYKKKSDKLNFVEDCLRDFGENNLEYYYSQPPVARFTGNDENIFSLKVYYPEYLVYMLADVFAGDSWRPYFKSLDAQIVWALLDRNREINLNTGQRFDVDNPLHRKLAAIAMQIEKQTKGRLFKGITERWEQDTETQRTRLEKAQDKAIRGRMRDISERDEQELEIVKKIKSGKKVPVKEIIGLSAEIFRKISASDLAGMDASDIYEVYAGIGRGKGTETQDRAMLELLIKRAPVDKDWYKKLSRYLVFGMYAYDYKLLSLFDKMFGKVAKEIEQDLAECEKEKKEQRKEYDGIRDKQAEVAKKIKELTQTRDEYWQRESNVNKLESDFRTLTKSGSKAEQEFYSGCFDSLMNVKNGKTKIAEITGHPWTIFGNKEEKKRLDDAKTIFNRLLHAYRHPLDPWTRKEDDELRNLDSDAFRLGGEESSARLGLNRLENQYAELSRDKEDFVDRFAKVMENARKEYLKKIESATQAFVKKYGRSPKKPVLTDIREK